MLAWAPRYPSVSQSLSTNCALDSLVIHNPTDQNTVDFANKFDFPLTFQYRDVIAQYAGHSVQLSLHQAPTPTSTHHEQQDAVDQN